jgi:hypothetical protein
MNQHEVPIDSVVEKLCFEKRLDDRVLECSVELLGDGSVYVHSEEFEILYEFADKALERAIARVESVGYSRSVR